MNVDAIRDYIQRQIMGDTTVIIEPDEDLLLTGRLDSLGVMRLVAHLESETGIEIPPEDVILENFGSLSRIHAYLSSRLG